MKKKKHPIIKIRSKVNHDIYYTSESFPRKFIDGVLFVGIKKDIRERHIFYMRKDSIEKC